MGPMSDERKFPTREEFLAELYEIAEAAKEVPFMPEEAIDRMVAEQTLLYDVVLRGLEAMTVDEAEELLRGDDR